jgi:hypothetical protein
LRWVTEKELRDMPGDPFVPLRKGQVLIDRYKATR